MNIRPLQDRVILKQLDAEKISKGGIIIPDSAKEKPQEGEVLAVGNGRTLDNGTLVKPECTVGDHVLFSKYIGSEVTVDGEKVMIVRADDIMGIVEK